MMQLHAWWHSVGYFQPHIQDDAAACLHKTPLLVAAAYTTIN